MSTSYIDLYEILDVFEDNAYQKIMMGAPYSNPEEIVIINCLKNNNKWVKEIFETAKNTLVNLIHSEILPDSVVLVTKYQEGIPISEYSKKIIDDNKRYYLSNDYLRCISAYETFNSYMQTILVDQNQIIMQENKLVLNSVMIVDEQIQNNLSFTAVIEKIKSSLETILYSGTPSFDKNENQRIEAFLATLNPTKNEYHCISDIVVAYENAFALLTNQIESDNKTIEEEEMLILPKAPEDLEKTDENENANDDIIANSLVADASIGEGVASASSASNISKQKEIELEGLTVVNEIFDEQNPEQSSQEKSNKYWGLILIILLLFLGISYAAYTHFYPLEKNLLPEASFVRTVNDDKQYFENQSVAFGKDNQVVSSEWTVYAIAEDGSEKQIKQYNKRDLNLFIKTPGTYKTALKVQDTNGQWSEIVSEEFVLEASSLDEHNNNSEFAQATEKLDSLNINFDTNNITTAADVFRSGMRSIHFDLDKGSATITINDIFVDSGSILSTWVLSDTTEPVILNVTAFENGNKVFTHKKKHVFKSANTWEMVEMKLPNKSADKITITISGKGQLWVDDIDINKFK